MLSNPSFSSPLINEDLPAGPQLVFTLNNRFFRHQACYSLLPAKPGGQADRAVSLCKYKVVVLNTDIRLGSFRGLALHDMRELSDGGYLSTNAIYQRQ
jgi:hypothetical protein